MKEFIVAVWEVRKQKLYSDDSYPGQLQRQSSAGDRVAVAGVGGRVGKSGKSGISHGKGEGHVVDAGVNCVRPEDIMLKNLMIILFFQSHQYQQLCFCVLNEYSFFLAIMLIML